jgi:hypothetical protein
VAPRSPATAARASDRAPHHHPYSAKRFDDRRSALMRHELARMADAPGMPDFAVGIVKSLLA